MCSWNNSCDENKLQLFFLFILLLLLLTRKKQNKQKTKKVRNEISSMTLCYFLHLTDLQYMCKQKPSCQPLSGRFCKVSVSCDLSQLASSDAEVC